MTLSNERPSLLPYRSRDGVYTTHFSDGQASFSRFIETVLAWTSARSLKPELQAALSALEDNGGTLEQAMLFRWAIVESFLYDTVELGILATIIAQVERVQDDLHVLSATEEPYRSHAELLRDLATACKFRVLLAKPASHFAISRARAIGANDARELTRDSLSLLTRALIQDRQQSDVPEDTADQRRLRKARWVERSRRIRHWQKLRRNLNPLSADELCDFLNEISSDVPFDLKFFGDGAPSGPQYYLHDMVLAGRFSFGKTTAELPWELIVDDPAQALDVYDNLYSEFELLEHDANTSKVLSQTQARADEYVVFLSYDRKHRSLVKEIAEMIEAKQIRVFWDAGIRAGENWQDKIFQAVSECTDLVPFLSEETCKNPWINLETSLALTQKRRVVPALVGMTWKGLPAYLKGIQGVDVATMAGKEELLKGIVERAAKEAGKK